MAEVDQQHEIGEDVRRIAEMLSTMNERRMGEEQQVMEAELLRIRGSLTQAYEELEQARLELAATLKELAMIQQSDLIGLGEREVTDRNHQLLRWICLCHIRMNAL